MSPAPSILVVDNYDSFVYNLVQYMAELGADVTVRRNDEVSVVDVIDMAPDGVLVSPGPGHPRDAGSCVEVIRHCADARVPMFGVCLGHQALGEAFGATIDRAPELLHGRSSVVDHENKGVFEGVSNPLVVGRYHSLVVKDEGFPNEFVVTARSHGLIMGMRHRSLALEGVQFHPESVLTQDGYLMLANWLHECGSDVAIERAAALSSRMDAVRAVLPQPIG
ncbi:MAG TPA: gamma-glutamyl-gamma-aminobutyrate hydrolase family protein [Acidimicrobiales bacterium]|nr:gamma-glutamyl-gamma-aminobutyrate hydrolase family protein [Acidimicrobiales bacterium]